jgi:hypothetical protein
VGLRSMIEERRRLRVELRRDEGFVEVELRVAVGEGKT